MTLRKGLRKLPPLYAIPTTAGTGSETTIVAVVSDPKTHAKYTVMDFPLLPKRVFLDADLTRTLPARVTAQSGMDALVHAVEAYVNGYVATAETRRQARQATEMIFRYLPRAYADGADLEARDKMLTAAFLAGQAFGRATVGYAHSIAHAVGGLTGMAHRHLSAAASGMVRRSGCAAPGRAGGYHWLHNAGNERHSQGSRFYQGSVRAALQSRPRRIAASARCYPA